MAAPKANDARFRSQALKQTLKLGFLGLAHFPMNAANTRTQSHKQAEAYTT